MKPLYIKIMLGVILLVVFFVTYIFLLPSKVKADAFQFYANECDGGFENSGNATGTRDVVGMQISEFNDSNSAVLKKGMQAELHCRKFKGEIIEGSVPKRITAKFSWAATYPLNENTNETSSIGTTTKSGENTFDTGPAVILPADIVGSSTGSAASSDETKNNENLVEPIVNDDKILIIENKPEITEPIINKQEEIKEEEPSVEMPSVQQESPVSILNLLGSFAYAEEVVTTTDQIIEILPESTTTKEIVIDEISATATDTFIGSTTAITTSSSTVSSFEPYGLVEVLYSIDGKTLNKLGYVEADNFDKTEFEIPFIKEFGWKDIENIQIFIRSVPSIDNISPTIYVDSVWLDVEYDKAGQEIHPFPSVDRGDIFEGGVSYENYVAFLINRPIVSNSSTTISSLDITESSSSMVSTDTKEDLSYETELWVKDNTSTSTESWIFVTDNKNLIKDTKVFFCYGYVFWIGSNNTLWTFNPKSSAYNSYSIEIDKPTQFQFNDEAGGIKILIISQPDNMFAFEDYIPEMQNDN